MRKKIIAGNWKMNKTVAESAQLAMDILALAKQGDWQNKAEIIVCPTFLALEKVASILQGTGIHVGAQDAHWENQGAFTGKVSVDMLKAIGVTFVILGHSEQRTYFHETDETVNRKTKKVLTEGLTPIVCLGETLAERERNLTEKVVEMQIRGAYTGLSAADAQKTVIAYEPVWAIGTGKTASDEQAQEVHLFIRQLLVKLYDSQTAEVIRIQYGGSMKPDNAKGLLQKPDVDGGLIGGASLKADSFLGIIQAV